MGQKLDELKQLFTGGSWSNKYNSYGHMNAALRHEEIIKMCATPLK